MIRALFLAAVLTAFVEPAQAQVLRQQLERWAEQCGGGEDAGEVIRACTSIIRSDSASSSARAYAYRQRGAAHLEQDDRVRALADFDGAIQHNPHFAAAFISRAAIYEAQGEYNRAVEDYDEVIRIAPEFGPAYNARCWLRTLSGRDLILARADCDRAVAMNVGAPAYDSRGLLNLRAGDPQAAWTDYDMAVRANPGDAHSRHGRGIAALRLNRGAEGQADLDAAAVIDGTIAAAYAGYGVTP